MNVRWLGYGDGYGRRLVPSNKEGVQSLDTERSTALT